LELENQMTRTYNKDGQKDTLFGRAIRRRMKTLGMGREDLRKKLRVSVARVSQLFNYPHMLRESTIARLAKALDMDADKLLLIAWKSRRAQ